MCHTLYAFWLRRKSVFSFVIVPASVLISRLRSDSKLSAAAMTSCRITRRHRTCITVQSAGVLTPGLKECQREGWLMCVPCVCVVLHVRTGATLTRLCCRSRFWKGDDSKRERHTQREEREKHVSIVALSVSHLVHWYDFYCLFCFVFIH